MVSVKNQSAVVRFATRQLWITMQQKNVRHICNLPSLPSYSILRLQRLNFPTWHNHSLTRTQNSHSKPRGRLVTHLSHSCEVQHHLPNLSTKNPAWIIEIFSTRWQLGLDMRQVHIVLKKSRKVIANYALNLKNRNRNKSSLSRPLKPRCRICAYLLYQQWTKQPWRRNEKMIT